MAEISSNDPRPWSIGAGDKRPRQGSAPVTKRCPMLSVSLDDEDTTIQWDVRVEARRGEEGFATVGVVRSHAVGILPTQVHNRIVVQAVVVGALEWQVTCTPVASTVKPAKADIRSELGLAVEECCPGSPGFFPTQFASLRDV